ncbi:hypothetical protein [Anatilimnocola floriformis]|uniref:hypothetical protein n=1 Tax=Anatilimnocola floriformis TaxID=2948575 RepID=UPI0020C27AB8|nr:hypothetical protein [Anatilimnocola floriformis]
MNKQTIREYVRPIITAVLRKCPDNYGVVMKERALFGHYPFKKRCGWRYKIWRDEIRIQLQLRPPRMKCGGQVPDSPGQTRLFA